jgi:hypothetical protein
MMDTFAPARADTVGVGRNGELIVKSGLIVPGKAYTVATLPTASADNAGMSAHTSDAGLQVSDGVNWGAGGRSLRLQNGFAFIGDSRNAQVFADSGQTRFAARHWWVQANSLLGNRMLCVYNGAVSAQRSDQYLSVLATAIASRAKWLVIWGVVNDITAGYTPLAANAFWAAIQVAATRAAAAGMNVILVSETGISTFSSAQQGSVNQYNQLCRELAESVPGIYYFDINSSLLDPAQAAPTFRTGYSTDGTHPITLGGAAAGSAFATAFGPLVAPFGSQPANGSDVGAKGGLQLLTNPAWITATGATFGGGSAPSGDGPANWYADAPTGYTTVSSVTVDKWRLAITASAAGTVSQYFYLIPEGDGSNYGPPVAGNIYQCGCEVTVAASSSNYVGPQVRMLLQLDGVNYQPTDMYAPAADGPGPTTAYTKSMKSPKLTVPAFTTVNQWYFYVEHIFSAAGSATVDLSRPWLRKRYS